MGYFVHYSLLLYIGIGMTLFGLFLALVTATSSFTLTEFTILGLIRLAMGSVLIALGVRMGTGDRKPIESN